MPNCREFAEARSSGRELGFFGRLNHRLHCVLCAHCWRFDEQIKALGVATRRRLADEARGEPGRLDDLRARILADQNPRGGEGRPEE
jgi:hypothetical protein